MGSLLFVVVGLHCARDLGARDLLDCRGWLVVGGILLLLVIVYASAPILTWTDGDGAVDFRLLSSG